MIAKENFTGTSPTRLYQSAAGALMLAETAFAEFAQLGLPAVAEVLALPPAARLAALEERIAGLAPDKRLLLAQRYGTAFREAAQVSLAAYIAYLDPGFAPAAHHHLLIDLLEAVERGECERAMIMMPPGSAKSTYATVLFPAWCLGRNPKKSVIAASHTQPLLERFARRSRGFYSSPEHQRLFPVPLTVEQADQWETAEGGEYFAVGVGGAIAGRRGDLGLIDDPLRSREDADSERIRNRVWDWYVNDFVPRLKPGASRILIMTRWHEDDLAGRLLATEPELWRCLTLPMEARGDDPLGRQPGERLWPEWFTDRMLADAKRDTRAWNALYQQEPAGEQGDYFKRDWLRDNEGPPERLAIYGASDYAVTEGGGDYTEHGVFGVDPWSNVHIIDWWRGQTAPDEWIEAKISLIKKHKPLCWFGEAGPIRRAVEPFLLRRMSEREVFCRIEWLPSINDKASRCRPFQALAASGKVFFPATASWKADLQGQLLRFPAGRYDDGVDVCSLLGRGLEHVRSPELDEPRFRQSHYNTGYADVKARQWRGRHGGGPAATLHHLNRRA